MEEKKKIRRLSTNDLLKVSQWFQAHPDEVSQHVTQEIIRRVKADTGIDITHDRVNELATFYGITRKPTEDYYARRDRAHILAVEVVRFMNAMGFPISNELKSLIDRK